VFRAVRRAVVAVVTPIADEQLTEPRDEYGADDQWADELHAINQELHPDPAEDGEQP
jgi:hypothetical protein